MKLSSEFRRELRVWLMLRKEASLGHWFTRSMTTKSEMFGNEFPPLDELGALSGVFATARTSHLESGPRGTALL